MVGDVLTVALRGVTRTLLGTDASLGMKAIMWSEYGWRLLLQR